MLKTSDIMTLHVPLLDSTRHMIGEKQLREMKDDAVMINTARGALIDNRALFKAIESGKIAGAGLDVVEEEPLTPGHELLSNPNIIITPHIGGGTADIGDFIIPMLVQDIKDYAEKGSCAHVVNRQDLM